MAVFRIEKNNNYTTMANFHFRDKRLSWKAKGILSSMLSLPEDWDYSLAGLVTLSTDGTSATRTALKELEEYGYLIRRPIREKGKILDWEYLIFEKPQVEKPFLENPQVENPLLENQTQLNTNELNTNELNTKETITKQSIIKEIKDIISRLNEKTGASYRATTGKTRQLISARLNEGFTVNDFYTVIEKKCAEWSGTEWQKYLRPETLFGTKFESYLNAPAQKMRGVNGVALGAENNDLDGIL